jgi:phospholipid/cholesterol/gamma-HCH transport system substrate-binding protein
MEPEARYTLVGTAVVVLLAALAAAIVWLAASRNATTALPYKVYFARQSLEGLEVRSDVRMKGIRVGAVSGFTFSRERKGTVEVALAINPGTPVLESTHAVVDRNLVTGLATIRLLNLDESSPPLKPPALDEPAVIAEGSTQLQQFSDTVNQLAQRADETLRRVNTVLSDKNQVAIAEVLDNVRELTDDSSGVVARLDKTLASIGGAAESLRTSVGGMSGDVHRLAQRYDTLGAETTSGVRDVVESVRLLRGDVTQLMQRTDSVLASSDDELRLTGQQLRQATDAVGIAAKKLSDPRAAFFGPSAASLGPGEGGR